MRPESQTFVVNTAEEADQVAGTGEFPTIPEGFYATKVTDVKLEETKEGWPMYSYTFTVQSGDYKGRLQWMRRPVYSGREEGKKSTMDFVRGDAKALGLRLPISISTLEVARFMVKEAFGKLVTIRIGFGKGDYADRNEVKGLRPAESLNGVTSGATPLMLDNEES